MPTIILNGNMSASITGVGPVDVRGKRMVFVRCEYGATGSPEGTFGIKAGTFARRTDMGAINGGRFDFVGSQPNGTGVAGSITCEFETGAECIEVYYTRVGGGVGNTTAIVDVTAN